eukprot:CAMPEP_0117509366 /NCGR_PEP_ID=MMETSP0784-20121206/27437_1 /TAXON_ID=39447 /ORGANISM="" /LENGTH=484 /DNA_ID=CAMNT_0005304969 /DNA_START=120 /DNA_END=1574 /DNA_ORIENTATION=-
MAKCSGVAPDGCRTGHCFKESTCCHGGGPKCNSTHPYCFDDQQPQGYRCNNVGAGGCCGTGICMEDSSCKGPGGPKPPSSDTSSSSPSSIACPKAEAWPKMPSNIMDYNGIAWPTACFNDTEEQHFFIIGDWGGVFPHTTFNNRHTPIQPDIDPNAQMLVAGRMAAIAQTSKPKFVINVGDNIYPGGIGVPGQCNPVEGRFDDQGQAGIVFRGTFEDVYKGPGLDGVEWWGVLGNHDFGGNVYSTHWDQMIYYTWHSEDSRWLTPALYWSRRVQYNNFSADFFFVDTNICDAQPPWVDPGHNMCNGVHNSIPPLEPWQLFCNGTSITNPTTCGAFFRDLWNTQKVWLEAKLEASDADWQIVVTHYPPIFEPCMSELWKSAFGKYGVDLYISGHTHQQSFYYKEEPYGDTAWIISGGGGGITSEIPPDMYGNDDGYGFVDVVISKAQLEVIMYSHGGVEGATIVRRRAIVTPRARAAANDVEVVV